MEKIINAAKDIAKISELKLRIAEKEVSKEKLMQKLGKEVYSAYPALNLEAIKLIVDEIGKLDEEMNVLDDAIIAIKGLNKCPQCGALVKEDMNYCGQCGAKIEVSEPEVMEEEMKEEIKEDVSKETEE